MVFEKLLYLPSQLLKKKPTGIRRTQQVIHQIAIAIITLAIISKLNMRVGRYEAANNRVKHEGVGVRSCITTFRLGNKSVFQLSALLTSLLTVT